MVITSIFIKFEDALVGGWIKVCLILQVIYRFTLKYLWGIPLLISIDCVWKMYFSLFVLVRFCPWSLTSVWQFFTWPWNMFRYKSPNWDQVYKVCRRQTKLFSLFYFYTWLLWPGPKLELYFTFKYWHWKSFGVSSTKCYKENYILRRILKQNHIWPWPLTNNFVFVVFPE